MFIFYRIIFKAKLCASSGRRGIHNVIRDTTERGTSPMKDGPVFTLWGEKDFEMTYCTCLNAQYQRITSITKDATTQHQTPHLKKIKF